MKRLNAPKVRKVRRKNEKWTTTTNAGPHPSDESLPLALSLQGELGIARNKEEAKKILGGGEIQVDGKVRNDPKFPVGLMDVVSVPRTDKNWRVFYDEKGYLIFRAIEEEEAGFKLGKVVGKTPFKGDKWQLSLHDGKTVTGEFEDVEVGDTLKIKLPDLEVQDQFGLAEGSFAMIIGGSNVGRTGVIKDILKLEGPSSDRLDIEVDGEELQSPKEYVFVIGESEPEISLPEE